MPIDNDTPDIIKLGRDLQPGDVTNDGVVCDVNGLENFYRGEPHYEFFCLNDPCGIYSRRFNPKEDVTVTLSRKKILRAYDIIELGLLRIAANAVEDRNKLVRVKSLAIDRMNKKLCEMKKAIKENVDGQASEGCDV